MDPYRVGAAPQMEGRRLLPEDERPVRRVRASTFSDGSTRIRVRPRPGILAPFLVVLIALAFLPLGLLFTIDPFSQGTRLGGLGLLLVGAPAGWKLWSWWFGGERFLVSRMALVRRRRFAPWRRPDVFVLDDVSTVVVSGDGEAERLELQIGRRRIPICAGLGYRSDDLRWIAKRLRRAIDHARGR